MNDQTLSFFAEDAICEKMDESKSSLILPEKTNPKPWPPAGVKWYYYDDYTAIAHGDCRDILPHLEPVDLVLTDPPYGTNDGAGKVIRRGKTDTSFSVLDWDKVLPTNYIKELVRVMKDDTWGVIFTDNIAIGVIWQTLINNELSPRNTFYWIKYNKAPTPRANFKSCVETAVLFTKGRTTIKWKGGGNQANYIEMPFVSGGEKVDHPTQKPVKLIRHLINLFSIEGDTILDPFMGSGTTLVAAKQLGRKAVGIEIEERYCEIAVERLKQGVLAL